ncbi:response regulator [Mycobacterium sp. Y57]|uniref:response regulator n=1 Tax=Mycolicibacterium xanthum TaxID=2796469 RepID=UPI001C8459AB|nr:response regulator [Mycolicibacterium xanthum]MBX7435478.1 response regulator [Mycolicibacterium xanthum]
MILVVDDDEMIVALVSSALQRAGYDVVSASNGHEALQQIELVLPDLVVSDVNMPHTDGFEFTKRLRADTAGKTVPLIFLTSRSENVDVLAGLQLGADDYMTKPFEVSELVARVDAKIARRPVPAEMLTHDVRSGVLTEQRLRDTAQRELDRAQRTGRAGFLAALSIAEAPELRLRFGPSALDMLARQLAAEVAAGAGPLEEIGRGSGGQFLILLPETEALSAYERLAAVSRAVVGRSMVVHGERVWTSPSIGFVSFGEAGDVDDLIAKATVAAEHAESHLDLRPQRWTRQMAPQPRHRQVHDPLASLRTPFQILLTLVVGVVLPFFGYYWMGTAVVDVSNVAYLVVVAALLVTAASIWIEGLLALRPVEPPPAPPGAPPPASAIIAAYLPNEAATVMETIDAFLAVDYGAATQIILAYNTPRPLPIESALQDIAGRDPRFVPFKVEGSTSKAQNVNAALTHATGEFVGIFDADHCPDPDSFSRAWQWLGNGYDVVQGHSVIRNGDTSWVARTIAVEFEAIYAVSHPGRTRLHGFGIFGGSNGYWRTSLLRETRMRGSMLTEDIDSSLRVVENGARIASDPKLVSRELAPTTVRALWNQRMRWAQGWFQVSLRHLKPALTAPALTLRQKLGCVFLLGWREVYPWISIQMFPIIAYKAVLQGGLANLDWLIAIFVITTIFTLSVGPGQTLFSYLKADPEIRRHTSWFWSYLAVSSLAYTEFKNIIARVAQLKEVMRERAWKVTPRTGGAGASEASGASRSAGAA